MAAGVLPIGKHWEGFDNLTRLPTVLDEGGPVLDRKGRSRVTSGGVVEEDPDRTRAFMDMLYRRSDVAAAETARLLAPWATHGHCLDLGGGHGRYGHELTRHGIAVTLFDRALCCEIAKERYGDALATRAGDFMEDELGGPYDLVLMSNIVHGCSPDELAVLLAAVRAAMNPGGRLAIKDMFLDATMASPEAAALFGLTMLMYTAGGRSYARQEMVDSLQAAGFPEVDFIDVPDQRFSLILAR
jgi:SAM-dependent methyltransferase